MSIKYENRMPDEGINVTPHNPALHFLKLMAMALVFVVLLVVTLNTLGSALAKKIPFKYELSLMEKIDIEFGHPGAFDVEAYLQSLSDSLGRQMDIPSTMRFDIHYNGESTFNAYATLGGNLVFYRGLLEKMPNENALAMVLAHEMAHVIHRHPASGMGGGLSSVLALMLLDNAGGGGVAGDILSGSGSLTQMGFSRDMEREADRTALAALYGHYGHVDGATGLFDLMGASTDLNESRLDQVKDLFVEFGSTHPLSENRIDAVHELAADNLWPQTGEMTPLPEAFRGWLLESPAVSAF